MAFPFDGELVERAEPFFFWQSERTAPTVGNPIICGYLKSCKVGGGIDMGEFMMANSQAAVRTFVDKHGLTIDVQFGESSADAIIELLGDASFSSRELEVPGSPDLITGQCQLIVPQMVDDTKCGFGLWVSRCSLAPKYDITMDGKSEVLLGGQIIALEDDGVIQAKGTLFTYVQPGSTVDLSPTAAHPGYNDVNWNGTVYA